MERRHQPQGTQGSGRRSDLGWTGLPKFDKQNRPRCFKCNQYGHFTAECHGEKESFKTRLETNMTDLLTPRQAVDLVTTEVNRQTLAAGTRAGPRERGREESKPQIMALQEGKKIVSTRRPCAAQNTLTRTQVTNKMGW